MKKKSILEWVMLICALWLMWIMFTQDLSQKELVILMIGYVHIYTNMSRK